MNTPNPLVPQGTLPVKGKSPFFFKVLMILAVHVVVISGMLLQGCKDTKDSSTTSSDSSGQTTPPDTTPPPAVTSTANISNNIPPTPPPATGPATPPAGAPGAVANAPIPPPVPVTPVAPPDVTPAAKDYVTIASGDTLDAVAHKNGVKLKALLDANPGINPKKLQVGQKVLLPGGTGAGVAAATPAGVGAAPDAMSGDSSVYVVKSGDTLGKIARLNHTSYKKIMALNDLKTTSIKAGQKLKLPGAAGAAPVVPTAPTLTPPVTTAATSPTTTSN